MKEKSRLNHFDLLKLIATLFVCFAHVYQRVIPSGTKTIGFGVFYSVHMSMFMFVGGYFIKRCDTLKGLGKYVLKMLLTYIYPAVLFTLLTVISMQRYQNKDVLHWFKEFFVRTDTFYWYAISAMIINGLLAIAFFVANKIIKKDGLKVDLIKHGIVLVFFAILFLPIIYIYRSETPGMLASNLTVEFVPLAVTGFLFSGFGKYIKQTKKTSIMEVVVAVICLIAYIIALINFRGWLDKSTDLRLILHQLGALCGVYYYYVLSKWLCKIKVVQEISQYGAYSYPVYLVHVYFIRVITPYVSKITEVNFYTVSFVIIYALVFALGSMVASVMLARNKYTNLLLFGDYKLFLKKTDKKQQKV